MTDSSRSPQERSRTAMPSPTMSPVSIILFTALDTTWRLFAPILGAVWAGIALDHWLGSAPWATIVCLTLGTFASIWLVWLQLRAVRLQSQSPKGGRR